MVVNQEEQEIGSAIGETSSSAFPSEGSETEPNPEEKSKIHHRTRSSNSESSD